MTLRAAIVRGIRVETTMVAPLFSEDRDGPLAFARWAERFVGPGRPFEGCELVMLRADEAVSPGDLRDGAGWRKPPTPLERTLKAENARSAAAITSGYRVTRGAESAILSTSLAAQIRWLGALATIEDRTFPFLVNTADDRGTWEVRDADELRAIVRGIAGQTFGLVQDDIARKRLEREDPKRQADEKALSEALEVAAAARASIRRS